MSTSKDIPIEAPTGSKVPATDSDQKKTARSPFGLGFMDSLLNGFENGIEKVKQKVDAASIVAANFINETLDAADDDEEQSDGTVRRQRPTTSFFGTSLKDLVLDELRCSHARLNPLLGIPLQAVKLINFIGDRVDSPDLFRQRASLSAVAELRKMLEEERGIPPDTDIATVAHVLIQWLNQLPEPLLGYEHYDALVACQNVVDNSAVEATDKDTHKVRNLTLLVQEAPWYCRPLLVKVMSLLGKCVQPEHSATNKLNSVAVAVLAAPFLLRPFTGRGRHQTAEELEQVMLAAAAAGSAAAEYLITHQSLIFQPMRLDLTQKQNTLAAKVARIRTLQEQLSVRVNCEDPDSLDLEQQRLIRELWRQLAPTEKQLSFTEDDSTMFFGAGDNDDKDSIANSSSSSAAPLDSLDAELFSDMSIAEVVAHPRWTACGFTAPLMKEFNAQNGLVALTCLSGFLKGYEEKGSAILVDFSQSRRKFCTIVQVASRLTHFTADVLCLLPSMELTAQRPFPQQHADIHRIAGQPAWALLTDEKCFQGLFDVAMLAFDDAWRNLCDRAAQLPTAETYSLSLFKCRKTLWDIVGQRPRTVAAVWELWMGCRLAEQEELFDKQAAAAAANRRSPMTTVESSVTNRVVQSEEEEEELNSGGDGDNSSVQSRASPTGDESTPASATTRERKPSNTEPIVIMHNTAVKETAAAIEPSASRSPSTQQSQPQPHIHEMLSANNRPTSSFTESRRHDDGTDWNVDLAAEAMQVQIEKTVAGITTHVIGGSSILSEKHIQQLESILPQSYQCRDWRLLYRLSIHGADLNTMVQKAEGVPNSLLVIRDSRGAVFGALVTEQMRLSEKDKYYGNGTIGVWSFASGSLQYYGWTYKNSYFLITSREALAVGGGGSFAIRLDNDLNNGSSGPCDTFDSPCLASDDQFVCNSCELYAIESFGG